MYSYLEVVFHLERQRQVHSRRKTSDLGANLTIFPHSFTIGKIICDLPELIELSQFGGNFKIYLEAVYVIFYNEFVKNKSSFRDARLALKKYPLTDGKEATFWHMTSEGEDEENRIPDFRRLERIKWPSFIINNSEHPYLRVWENKRGNKTNILIMHEQENYVVILRKGNGYLLPWTPILLNMNSARRKSLGNTRNM